MTEVKKSGDPNCKTCFGAGEIMHGEMIPCPVCSPKPTRPPSKKEEEHRGLD